MNNSKELTIEPHWVTIDVSKISGEPFIRRYFNPQLVTLDQMVEALKEDLQRVLKHEQAL